MDTVGKWSEYLSSERRFSPLTVKAYTDDIKAFIEYTENTQYNPRETTFNDLRSYIMYLVERGDNPKSTNRHISALKSYFRYMVRCGIIEKDPTLKLRTLAQQTTLPEFISQKSGAEIVRHLMEWSDDREQQRNALVVILLFTTGIRRAELATLRIENIDLAQQKIKVLGKGHKEREIPLLPEVRSMLERYIQGYDTEKICKSAENFLFLSSKSAPISTGKIYLIVKETLRNAGVQGKQSPHVLRHSFATYLMAEGASLSSIQELLGHSSLKSTEIYTHNTIEKLKESYAKAHPRAQEEL